MKRSVIFGSALVALIVFMACGGDEAPAGNGEASAGKSGEKLYQMNCLSCHGADGKLGLGGASDLSTSEMPLEDRIKLVTEGKGRMMPFGDMLSEKEIKAVSEYSLTLKQ